MTSEKDGHKVLSQLGLTGQQAKLYFAIAKLGQASVKEISKATKIDRGQVYRIVAQLQEKDLIEKVLNSPIEFRVISFKASVNALLKKRKRELSQIEQNAAKIIQAVKHNDSKLNCKEENLSFVSSSSSCIQKMVQKIIDTKTSFDIITSLDRVKSGECPFKNALETIVEKGVRTRFLVEEKHFNKYGIAHFQSISRYPSLTIKTTSESVGTPLAIFDKNEAYVFISDNVSYFKASVLIANKKRLVKVFQKYFDELWKEAKRVPNYVEAEEVNQQ